MAAMTDSTANVSAVRITHPHVPLHDSFMRMCSLSLATKLGICVESSVSLELLDIHTLCLSCLEGVLCNAPSGGGGCEAKEDWLPLRIGEILYGSEHRESEH
jgi:hypothetical protein